MFAGDPRSFAQTATLPAKQYVDSAGKMSGFAGWVELEVRVNADGSVKSVRLIDAQPPGMFEVQAMTAVQRWKYQQKFVDGVAVEQRGTQRISFGPTKK